MKSENITREQLCAMFDHTNLKPYAVKMILKNYVLKRLLIILLWLRLILYKRQCAKSF